MNVIQNLLDDALSQERVMRAHALGLSNRIQAWVVAGHGGGLLLCLNAFLDHKICDWPSVQPVAQGFLFGLVLALGSVILSMRDHEEGAAAFVKICNAFRLAISNMDVIEKLGAQRQGATADELEMIESSVASAEAETSKNLDQIGNVQRAKNRYWSPLSNWSLGISGLVFGVVIFAALSGEMLGAALCPVGTPPAASEAATKIEPVKPPQAAKPPTLPASAGSE